MNFITRISKAVFFVSLILNAILLMYLIGVLPFLLYVSVLINAFLVWYAYLSLIENQNIEEEMSTLYDKTEEFIEHLEQIHELEMYYGDQNLQNLIDHSKRLINDYIDIQEKHFDVEIELELDEEDTDEEASPQEE